MLHEKIISTVGLIEEVEDNRHRENENINMAKRNSTFFDALAKITPSIRSYILVKKYFGFTLQPNTADSLKYVIDYSKKTFAESKAINPTPFKQRAESFIDAIGQEWTAFYKTKNSELVNGLNIIVLVHPSPSIVRNCINTFNKCEKWPLSQEMIEAYEEARTNADALMKEMRFDDEIKDFLEKVRDRKATLNDLTTSILEWIKTENISDKVSLSIRNTIQ